MKNYELDSAYHQSFIWYNNDWYCLVSIGSENENEPYLPFEDPGEYDYLQDEDDWVIIKEFFKRYLKIKNGYSVIEGVEKIHNYSDTTNVDIGLIFGEDIDFYKYKGSKIAVRNSRPF